MTEKAIRAALAAGRRVQLRGDPYHLVCIDLFGDLYVESVLPDEPPRPIGLGDKRRAKRAFRGLPFGHPCPMRGGVNPTPTEGEEE